MTRHHRTQKRHHGRALHRALRKHRARLARQLAQGPSPAAIERAQAEIWARLERDVSR